MNQHHHRWCIITIIMRNNTIVKGALCSCCANEIRSQMEEKRKGRAWKWDRWLLLDLILTKIGEIALRDFLLAPHKNGKALKSESRPRFGFTTMISSRNFFSRKKKQKKCWWGKVTKAPRGKGLFSLGSHGRIFKLTSSEPEFFYTFLEKKALRPCVM